MPGYSVRGPCRHSCQHSVHCLTSIRHVYGASTSNHHRRGVTPTVPLPCPVSLQMCKAIPLSHIQHISPYRLQVTSTAATPMLSHVFTVFTVRFGQVQFPAQRTNDNPRQDAVAGHLTWNLVNQSGLLYFCQCLLHSWRGLLYLAKEDTAMIADIPLL